MNLRLSWDWGGRLVSLTVLTFAGGKVLSVNVPKKWIERFQVVEYARSFNVGRTALSALGSLIVLSGVFSIFRRDLLVKVGGYLTRQMNAPIGVSYCKPQDVVCEDMEIVVRLYRYLKEHKLPGKIAYLPFPIAWTEVPTTYGDLFKQRNRWNRGLAESLWLHKKMLLNPAYKRIGLFAMPYQFIFEFVAPLVELVGLMSLVVFYFWGYLNVTYLALFVSVAIIYGMLLSVLTLLLGLWIHTRYRTKHLNYNIFYCKGLADILLLILFALLSNIGYRQFLLFAQAKGFIDYMRGNKSWEKFGHKGFKPTS